ncbi:hypothetical protein MRX96_046401 [Rhipicephalus microplus]
MAMKTNVVEQVKHEEVSGEGSSNVVTDAHKLEYIRNILSGAQSKLPFWPYATGATGYVCGATKTYESGGQSVATGEFSAKTSSDACTAPYYAEEDASRNTTADWEDSEMAAQKTESVADTIGGSYPESGFDSVAGSEMESDVDDRALPCGSHEGAPIEDWWKVFFHWCVTSIRHHVHRCGGVRTGLPSFTRTLSSYTGLPRKGVISALSKAKGCSGRLPRGWERPSEKEKNPATRGRCRCSCSPRTIKRVSEKRRQWKAPL